MKFEMKPGTKRALVLGAAGVALVAVAGLVVTGEDQRRPQVDRASIDSIITNTDNAETTITGIAGRLSQIENSLTSLEGKLSSMQNQRDSAVRQLIAAIRRDVAESDTRTRAELDRLEDRIIRGQEGAPPALPDPLFESAPPASSGEGEGTPAAGPVEPPPVPAPAPPPAAVEDERRSLAPRDVFSSGAEPPVVVPDAAPGSAPPPGGRRTETAGLSVRVVRGKPAEEAMPAGAPALEGRVYTIPSGSILSGTLLSGLDASTSAGASSDPVPVLVRLKHLAILPNRYAADVRECFVLLAAYGDLSSERANMRGEKISCVLRRGGVVENRLQAFVTGEDGKQGLRGRLVRKEGQFIARALLVGLLEGAASALGNRAEDQTISVDSTGTLKTTGGRDALNELFRGTSGALDRISEFYLEQAKEIFPVIEVDVGRQVDIILTQPLTIRLDK